MKMWKSQILLPIGRCCPHENSDRVADVSTTLHSSFPLHLFLSHTHLDALE